MTRPLVGVLVNPMAGRDIRRLVAHARVASGPDKLLSLLRVTVGVAAAGAGVLVADDPEGLGRELARTRRDVELLEVGEGDRLPDTTAWVMRLEQAGVAVIVSIGGDGTQRQVALAAPRVPVLPLAGGTNNLACWTGDETAAGLAAGRVAAGHPAQGRRAKVIHVRVNDTATLALVDVALVRQPFVGALAVWDPADVLALAVTVADPVRPGLSNPGGRIRPLTSAEDRALTLTFGPEGTPVAAVVAPGLVRDFRVKAVAAVDLEVPVRWAVEDPSTVALDGERTIMVRAGDTIQLVARRDGPLVLNPEAILRESAFEAVEER
jgi:hypothetical protein